MVSVQLQERIRRLEESTMTALETVSLYYDAWQNKHGDFSDVPLAEDFEFTGPVASFDSADGYRAMAREAGQAVTSFAVRRQFVDGNTVCSIIDWEMAIPGLGRMTSAELLEVVDGVIVRGELIYDAEALRHAMAHSTA
jgi:ketosteroid isomerase-like protein